MTAQKSLIFSSAFVVLACGFLAAATPAVTAGKVDVLYAFCSEGGDCPDGAVPEASVIFDAEGNLYGTLYDGGVYNRNCNFGYGGGCGTVFELVPQGDGTWAEKVLHTFEYDKKDGTNPAAGLILDAAGNLYGTTLGGGKGKCIVNSFPVGCGTVFELSPRADGEWTYRVLHNFSLDGGDGYYPYSNLTLGANGNLYGTTARGGSNCVGYWGCGTVFELFRDRGGCWKEKVLYSFCHGANCPDGAVPYAGVIFDAAGNMYGTTWAGGNVKCASYGTVFELHRCRNGKWTEKVLFSFDLNDGSYPDKSLVIDADRNLYGTNGTTSGFLYHAGAVFKLSKSSRGTWTETVLHVFGNGNDGAVEPSSLVFDADGNLYGTTWAGGEYGGGTVFTMMRCGKDKWTEKVLHSFKISWGGGPWAGVIFNSTGNMYGTTMWGGKGNSYCLDGCGTVFEIAP